MSRFLFLGNHPCLDFVNTLILREGEPFDLLSGYTELVAWSVDAGLIVGRNEKKAVMAWADEKETAFRQAVEFRAALRDSMERIVAGKKVGPSIIKTINDLLEMTPVYRRVVTRQGRPQLRIMSPLDQPLHLLARIAETAADLFCNGDPSLIKKCENPRCILFFYDETKNRGRRWCSMSGCGNRMKVAAYYDRRRKQKRSNH